MDDHDSEPPDPPDNSQYDPQPLGWRGCAGFGMLGLIFALCLLSSSCISTVEVMKAVSPNRAITARVFEVNGGATTDFAYIVYANRNWPIGWKYQVAGFYGAGRSSCAYGVNIQWVTDDTLLITYLDAKSAFVERTTRLFDQTMHTITRKGINDAAAPCGGMEYGQKGKIVVH